MTRIVLLLPLALIACGTPQERCINAATRDQRVVERLIIEAETNLKRGYALEDYTTYRSEWVQCGPAPKKGKKPAMCLDDVPEVSQRPVAIDLAAETRKRDQLRAKRNDLIQAQAATVAQCRVANPE